MDKKMMIAIGLIGAGAFIIGMTLAPQKTGAPEQPIAENGMIAMEIIAIHDDTNKLYRLDAEYPQFKGAMDEINRSIAAYATEELVQFKQTAQENWQARKDTMPAGKATEEYPAEPFTFLMTWEPKQLNKTYISLIMRVDAYEGGANVRREIRTFNYDVVNGKEMKLSDLFPGDSMYLGRVAKFAYDRLVEDLQAASEDRVDLNMIAEGTAPTQDNFKYFVFDQYVIDLYFPKYQVAPGVFGEQRVVVSRQGIW